MYRKVDFIGCVIEIGYVLVGFYIFNLIFMLKIVRILIMGVLKCIIFYYVGVI